MDGRGSQWWRSRWALFLALVLVGGLLRVGYGVARHQDALSRTGADFIALWDFDALEHVLIARSLLQEGAYRVGPETPDLVGKNVRHGEHDALFKAPLYQYFLAGVFALSGFSLVLLLPLQALIGGIASGLAALAALEVFRSWRVAAFAGLAAAGNPLLVNTASQPYNETVFAALLLGALWAFVVWLRTPRMRWVVAAGVLSGLAILCRESAAPLLAVMAAYAMAVRPAGARRSVAAAGVMIGIAALTVAPWSARNVMRAGTMMPVASITGTALSLGNNECLAAEPLLTWYWAEEPCLPLNAKRQQLISRFPEEEWDNRVIRNSINAGLAKQFITERPFDYLKLTAQRAWTMGLPFHPRQEIGTVQRAALLLYWVAVVPAGLLGIFLYIRVARGPAILLLLLIGAVVVPQVLVYFSPDMRYRFFADLLLAGFAGWVYVSAIERVAGKRVARAHRAVPAAS